MDLKAKASVCEFSFAEKVRIFSADYLKCCAFITTVDDPKNTFNKKLFSKLISSSMLLEDFLDFHGAKNNKNWYLYREYSAVVRHLSLGANFQKHISNRLVFYDLANTEDFEAEGEKNLVFLTESLITMAPEIIEEARRLQIPIPAEQYSRGLPQCRNR